MNINFANNNSVTTKNFAQRCVHSCKQLLAQVEQTKNNLLSEFRTTRELNLFKQAVNEAEALAWQTEYPHLFFPTLALEKIQTASAWQKRQQNLRRHHSLYALAA